MSKLSITRQRALVTDASIVQQLYDEACSRFGTAAVMQDLSLVWIFRCMQGVTGRLPFSATVSQTLGEWLYVLREICQVGKSTDKQKGRML